MGKDPPSKQSADDLCPQAASPIVSPTHPHAPAIYLASVWSCTGPEEASRLLAEEMSGYVYQREGHPNADALAEKCRLLHGAEQACVVSSGMSALSVAVLSLCQSGDQIAMSNQLYGRSSRLLATEATRFGIECHSFDPLSAAQTETVLQRGIRLVVVETIANPMLRVVDLSRLSDQCRQADAALLVDNTFATPVLCRPLDFGADLVMESVSKAINGHSDVMLGLLAGKEECWERVPSVVSTWGFTAPPLDCWLAHRGLATLAVRMARACANAEEIADWLQAHPRIAGVEFPGLPEHPDHELSRGQLQGGFGTMVTFHLDEDTSATEFFSGVEAIPFCPSLGEVSTTLSHPASTSHRSLSAAEQLELGICPNTIRLSVGIELAETIIQRLEQGL